MDLAESKFIYKTHSGDFYKMKERITITINKRIWKALSKLKLTKDLKTFDDVLELLLKKYRGRGKRE